MAGAVAVRCAAIFAHKGCQAGVEVGKPVHLRPAAVTNRSGPQGQRMTDDRILHTFYSISSLFKKEMNQD